MLKKPDRCEDAGEILRLFLLFFGSYELIKRTKFRDAREDLWTYNSP